MPNLKKHEKLAHIFGALYIVFAFTAVLIGPSLHPNNRLPSQSDSEINFFPLNRKNYNEYKMLIARK